MASVVLAPCPAGLPTAQQQAWEQRHQTAARILARQTDPAPAADSAVLAHLQHYVRGEITLGQAVGRVLDHQARAGR